ncbi:hypothetical protein NW767_015274 [Fusarium falciforme]|nr:hypothetical protein NW767_015274 [Fusarium falciforme]
MFRSSICGMRQFSRRRADAPGRGHIDDAAAALSKTLILLVKHDTELLSLAAPDSVQVNLNQVSPVLLINCVSVDMWPFNACVVHGDIQATELFDDLFKCLLYLRRVSYIDLEW